MGNLCFKSVEDQDTTNSNSDREEYNDAVKELICFVDEKILRLDSYKDINKCDCNILLVDLMLMLEMFASLPKWTPSNPWKTSIEKIRLYAYRIGTHECFIRDDGYMKGLSVINGVCRNFDIVEATHRSR